MLNRAQLLDDSLNVARMGEVPYAVALDLTRYLRSERDYVPWEAALSAFDYLDRMLCQMPGKEKLRVIGLLLQLQSITPALAPLPCPLFAGVLEVALAANIQPTGFRTEAERLAPDDTQSRPDPILGL